MGSRVARLHVGFLLLREIDERFRIIDPMRKCLEDVSDKGFEKRLGNY